MRKKERKEGREGRRMGEGRRGEERGVWKDQTLIVVSLVAI